LQSFCNHRLTGANTRAAAFSAASESSDVAVDVQREGHGAVTETSLHHSGVDAGPEHGRGVGVPRSVQRDRGAAPEHRLVTLRRRFGKSPNGGLRADAGDPMDPPVHRRQWRRAASSSRSSTGPSCEGVQSAGAWGGIEPRLIARVDLGPSRPSDGLRSALAMTWKIRSGPARSSPPPSIFGRIVPGTGDSVSRTFRTTAYLSGPSRRYRSGCLDSLVARVSQERSPRDYPEGGGTW
jgi:hypothetical protein